VVLCPPDVTCVSLPGELSLPGVKVVVRRGSDTDASEVGDLLSGRDVSIDRYCAVDLVDVFLTAVTAARVVLSMNDE